jgi:RNA polymerase-binding transcription factor DksA
MPNKKTAHKKARKAAPKKKPKPVKKASVKKKTTPKKPLKKKTMPKKTIAKKKIKPAAKKAADKKPSKQVVQKLPVSKPAPKPVLVVPFKKPGQVDTKSLVTIKPKAKPVIKKEPPKPSKVVIPKTTTKSSVKYEPEFTKSVLDSLNIDTSGPTQRYSDNDLAEFKEIILKKLDTAKKELSYLQGLITRKDESGDMEEARYMTMEDGGVSMEREQLSQMASRQITFIDHLEKALMRIENKTYGICRVTGRLIDKARLRAVPHATLSIEAKQMMNK